MSKALNEKGPHIAISLIGKFRLDFSGLGDHLSAKGGVS
jgi:hypothetical protein